MKPKENKAGDPKKSSSYDRCQTPPAALSPLLPYIPLKWTIWEPACGEGLLVRALETHDHRVIATDILDGYNFFEWQPPSNLPWDGLITNPAYGGRLKVKFLARCYELGKPFAMLMPVEFLGTAGAQALFKLFGMEMIVFDRRVNFKMPLKGWDSHAQFPVAWYTHGLNIGREITYGTLPHVAHPEDIP